MPPELACVADVERQGGGEGKGEKGFPVYVKLWHFAGLQVYLYRGFSKDEGARSDRSNKRPSFFPLLQSPARLHRRITRRFLLRFSPHYLPFSSCTKEPDSSLVERKFLRGGVIRNFALYIYIYIYIYTFLSIHYAYMTVPVNSAYPVNVCVKRFLSVSLVIFVSFDFKCIPFLLR